MIKKEILCEFKKIVESCYIFNKYENREILTYVIKNKFFGIFTYYTIKQNIPYNLGFDKLDSEISTNRRLKMFSKQEKIKAEVYIINYKNKLNFKSDNHYEVYD